MSAGNAEKLQLIKAPLGQSFQVCCCSSTVEVPLSLFKQQDLESRTWDDDTPHACLQLAAIPPPCVIVAACYGLIVAAAAPQHRFYMEKLHQALSVMLRLRTTFACQEQCQ
jgi:hypothetical protein